MRVVKRNVRCLREPRPLPVAGRNTQVVVGLPLASHTREYRPVIGTYISMKDLFEPEPLAVTIYQPGLTTRVPQISFFSRDPMAGDPDVRFLPGWKKSAKDGEGKLDEEPACLPGGADGFFAA